VPDDIPLAQQQGRMTVLSCEAGRPAPDGEHAWDEGQFRWDVLNILVLGGTLFLVWASWPSGAQRVIATAALAAMALLYLLAGRRIMRDGYDSRAARVYLAALVALFALAQSQDPAAWLAAFALCPHCFQVVLPRRAIPAAIAVNVTGGALLIYRAPYQPYVAIGLSMTALGVTAAVVIGGYTLRIIGQSRERAELIGQLQATRAELAEAHRAAGMMAERQRLAAEIHDTIAQGFTSIVMLIQAADAAVSSDPEQARRHLGLAAQAARENLAEARALVAALTPAQLDGGRLDDALRRLAAQAAGQLDAGAGFELRGSPRTLATGTEVMLLRVCQEALANIRKHAGAGRACVRLSYGDGDVRLEVSDDGAGFDPAAASGGYGLRGMRARVTEAGGRLTVRSAPGDGTSVTVQVPA
jgi:signal transduction histidine kinase